MPNKETLQEALALSEQPLDGRKLLIKDGSDFTGRPDINTSALGIARTLPSATTSLHANKDEDEDDEQEKEAGRGEGEGEGAGVVKGKTGLTKTAQKILRAQKNPPSMTLFLGNLSFNTTEVGVRELFDHSATKRNPASKKKKEKKVRKGKKEVVKKKASSDSDSDSDEDDDDDSDSSSSSSSSSSDSDSDDEEDKDEEKKSDEETSPSEIKKEKKLPGQGEVVPSAAGIRKVRLGTFEDAPTKCKGFGFIDFHTIEQATASLLDSRNTFLDGRKIVLQFASADATRRGASKTQKASIPTGAKGGKGGKERNEKRVGFMTGAQKRSQFDRRVPRENGEAGEGKSGKRKRRCQEVSTPTPSCPKYTRRQRRKEWQEEQPKATEEEEVEAQQRGRGEQNPCSSGKRSKSQYGRRAEYRYKGHFRRLENQFPSTNVSVCMSILHTRRFTFVAIHTFQQQNQELQSCNVRCVCVCV